MRMVPGNGMIMLRKAICHIRYINILTWLRGFQDKRLYLVLLIIKRLRFVFALFGFAEAAKFRDSGEFSEFRLKCLGKSNQRNFAQREKT